MSKTTHVMAFTIGAAVGSVVAWFYTKKVYEQIAQEEIDSVKAIFMNREPEDKTIEVKAADIREREEKPGIAEYAARLQREGYTNYSGLSSDEKEEDVVSEPYVISPDSFGELDEYEQISLTFYEDQVLADENDEIVEDVEGTVGFESLTHFGEYEDDSVFVRNDRLKCDYEILMDERLYSDVVKKRPHPMEEE